MSPKEHYSLFETVPEKRFRSWWIVAFLLALTEALIPESRLPFRFHIFDLFLHLSLYTVLAFIPMIFFKCRKTTFLLAISMAPLGYLIEIIHAGINAEPFNALIALANNIGVLTGIAAGFLVRLKSHYQREGNPL